MMKKRRIDEKIMVLKRNWSSALFVLFRTYLIFVLSFVILYPLMYMISMGFRPLDEYTNPSIVWVPKTWTFDIVKEAISEIDYFNTLKNTALMALTNTVVSLVPCCLAGYGFARFEFKFKKLLFLLLILSIIVPPQTIIVPLYVKMRFFDFFYIGQIGRLFGQVLSVNLLDSSWAMILLSALGSGLKSGMFIFIFKQFFSAMPHDLEDAAFVDGAGFVRTFLQVIIPCASSPFLVVFILSMIWHWNDTFMTSLFDSTHTTLAFAVDNFRNMTSIQDVYRILQVRLAACLLFILPLLVMYLVLQRFFVQSIDRTGLK